MFKLHRFINIALVALLGFAEGQGGLENFQSALGFGEASVDGNGIANALTLTDLFTSGGFTSGDADASVNPQPAQTPTKGSFSSADGYVIAGQQNGVVFANTITNTTTQGDGSQSISGGQGQVSTTKPNDGVQQAASGSLSFSSYFDGKQKVSTNTSAISLGEFAVALADSASQSYGQNFSLIANAASTLIGAAFNGPAPN